MELPNRNQLDEEAIGSLAALSEHQRQEARKLMGQPPDIDNIPAATWQRWQRETESELAAILLLIFTRSALMHGALEDMSVRKARTWSVGEARELSRQIIITTHDQLSRTSDAWTDRLNQGETIPRTEVSEELDRIFGRNRIERISVDAVTRAQTAGGEWAIPNSVGKSEDDWWKNNPGLSQSGPCSTCSALHGQPREIWEADHPLGPPAHPGCVCEIRYVFLDNYESN